MSTKIHMAQDIRGALRLPVHELTWFTHDDGRAMTPIEAREALFDELAKGRELIPMGQCDGFDFITGCPGHPVED